MKILSPTLPIRQLVCSWSAGRMKRGSSTNCISSLEKLSHSSMISTGVNTDRASRSTMWGLRMHHLKPIVCLAGVQVKEDQMIHLMALTWEGARLYLSTTTRPNTLMLLNVSHCCVCLTCAAYTQKCSRK